MILMILLYEVDALYDTFSLIFNYLFLIILFFKTKYIKIIKITQRL